MRDRSNTQWLFEADKLSLSRTQTHTCYLCLEAEDGDGDADDGSDTQSQKHCFCVIVTESREQHSSFWGKRTGWLFTVDELYTRLFHLEMDPVMYDIARVCKINNK